MWDAFINTAVDETLARAIFWTISSGKIAGSLPLERLKVRVTGGGRFGNYGISLGSVEAVVNNLSRSWQVERLGRDDSRYKLIAEELSRRKREERDEQDDRLPHVATLRPDVEPIFRRLRPLSQLRSNSNGAEVVATNELKCRFHSTSVAEPVTKQYLFRQLIRVLDND
jgi:hypothetical protein